MLRARVSPRIATTIAIALSLGCAGHEVAKGAKPAVVEATPASGNPARPPEIVRIDPLKGASGSKTAGLVALEEELRRAMSALGKSGEPRARRVAAERGQRPMTGAGEAVLRPGGCRWAAYRRSR